MPTALRIMTLVYAKAGTSLITTQKGSLYVMPEEWEILELIQTADF